MPALPDPTNDKVKFPTDQCLPPPRETISRAELPDFELPNADLYRQQLMLLHQINTSVQSLRPILWVFGSCLGILIGLGGFIFLKMIWGLNIYVR
ncbi:MAG TPA: hypothetical protein DCE55_29405 [Planctomycetaceae bacterium]|nr:hypothetical protein [Planctomycetaceae bacterium]|tara:strand:- start:229 stop:513 length:285 start_codon:yes stop_codon:yes gene_type:complete